MEREQITQVQALEDYKLEVALDNGSSVTLNLKPKLHMLRPLDTSGVRHLKINNFSNDMFYAHKKDIGAEEICNARAYLIYQDGNGNMVTVYSENTVSQTMGGE